MSNEPNDINVPTTKINLRNFSAHPKNANTHDQNQIDELERSHKEFSQLKDLVVWKNYILTGHANARAFLQAEQYEVEAKDVSHWSEQKAVRWMNADNLLGRMGEYDAEIFRGNLDWLEDTDIPGLTNEVIEDLFGDDAGVFDGLFSDGSDFEGDGSGDESEAPKTKRESETHNQEMARLESELVEKLKVKPGQLWTLDKHRLYIGDAANNKDGLNLLLDNEPPGLVVTDPPFTFGLSSTMQGASKNGGWANLMNSALWFSNWYKIVKDILPDDGAMWTCCSWRSFPVVSKAAYLAEWGITSLLIWDKDTLLPGMKGLRPSYEMVTLFTKDDFQIKDRTVSDIWKFRSNSYKPTGHGAEKPVELFEKMIKESGDHERILDLFGGSGTTIIACEQLGRRGHVAEMDLPHAAGIINRWQELTGLKAKLLEG